MHVFLSAMSEGNSFMVGAKNETVSFHDSRHFCPTDKKNKEQNSLHTTRRCVLNDTAAQV